MEDETASTRLIHCHPITMQGFNVQGIALHEIHPDTASQKLEIYCSFVIAHL
jgi:hypothetical protein